MAAFTLSTSFSFLSASVSVTFAPKSTGIEAVCYLSKNLFQEFNSFSDSIFKADILTLLAMLDIKI